MISVIEVKGLSKHYSGLKAVDDISFQVNKGTCFGLLGPNGAGKTTTIEMMEGLIEPDAGEIRFFGEPLSKRSLQKIGIQFQHTALQDYLTVEETLDMFASFYQDTADISELMTLCNLNGIAKQDHKKLSGGQKQRLLLAIALVNKPQILFLDEPTTGLDPHARRNFWDLINTIKQHGTTIVLTTHYMDEAEYLCDEVVIMDQGKIIAQNPPQQLLNEHFTGAIIRLPKQNVEDKKIELPVRPYGRDHVDIDAINIEQSITHLMSSNVSLDGLQVKSANLDDLFIKLTGHKLQSKGGE